LSVKHQIRHHATEINQLNKGATIKNPAFEFTANTYWRNEKNKSKLLNREKMKDYFLAISEKNLPKSYTTITVCFMDLAKLNLLMVVRF
jgi:hypothetical protein